MPSCEKCWRDAALRSALYGDQAEAYRELIEERDGERICTPEEQAGEHAETCPQCGRLTLHQYAKVCMNPDCRPGLATEERDGYSSAKEDQ